MDGWQCSKCGRPNRERDEKCLTPGCGQTGRFKAGGSIPRQETYRANASWRGARPAKDAKAKGKKG